VFRIKDLGFRVLYIWGLGFIVEGLGFRAEGLRFRVYDSGIRIHGLDFST
jgi:hypothetical protein